MRVTADVDDVTYKLVRQRARVLNVSMGSLLGELIARGLKADPVQIVQSGRFSVIAAAPAVTPVSTAQIQQIIDTDGCL